MNAKAIDLLDAVESGLSVVSAGLQSIDRALGDDQDSRDICRMLREECGDVCADLRRIRCGQVNIGSNNFASIVDALSDLLVHSRCFATLSQRSVCDGSGQDLLQPLVAAVDRLDEPLSALKKMAPQ